MVDAEGSERSSSATTRDVSRCDIIAVSASTVDCHPSLLTSKTETTVTKCVECPSPDLRPCKAASVFDLVDLFWFCSMDLVTSIKRRTFACEMQYLDLPVSLGEDGSSVGWDTAMLPSFESCGLVPV